MEPSKTNKIGADSTPFDYPRNIREFCESLEIATRLLLEQIVRIDPVDIHGHKMTNNLHYKELQKILND